MSVDLKDKYREETNKDVYSDDNVYGGSGGSYSDQYVKWLEKQVKNNDLLHNVSESFEVGIEVKITKRIHGHEFEIGEVVEIVEKEIDGDDVLWWCSNGVDKWCIEEDEAERYYR